MGPIKSHRELTVQNAATLSSKGSMTLNAHDQLDILGSDVQAAQNINLNAQDINISSVDEYYYMETVSHKAAS
ncbi:MAG: hemagglutinin repeat-containing protein [Alphaproteobacteria bacterium]|nr:hemagglutinin repeat-containing protein [Alphaproteobacteria bacterium]